MFDLHDVTFWAMTAASLFNTVLMVTLGLTVLLTAPRRSLGATLAGLGLLLGGAFFAAHAALLDYDLRALILGVRSWWFFGWTALIALPGAWYALMLWYSGFWDDAASKLHRAHRRYFVGALLTALLLTFLVVFINPMRLLLSAAQTMLDAAPPREYSHVNYGAIGIALFVTYAVYVVSCLGLALDAVRRPAKSARLMGDVARRRARPWLLVTTLLLLLVSALFGGGLLWLMLHAVRGDLAQFGENSVGGVMWSLDWFDALVCILVGASTVTLGKALVSYDIFATSALPRSGLWRQWRRVVAVAALFSALLALALTINVRPVYTALLATLSLSGAFALLQWRATAERERALSQLQMLFRGSEQNLPRGDAFHFDDESGSDATFVTLCRDVLNARRAHLVPLNTLAPLAGEALHFPREEKLDARVLAAATSQQFAPATLCFALDAESASAPHDEKTRSEMQSLCWAVPLWNARGVIGLLLLGEKNGGALYTHEEMEMARTVCERLLDLRASAALSRRLMELQGRKLRESFVMDNRARRVLHDDILPQLHAAMLSLGASQSAASTRDTTNATRNASQSETTSDASTRERAAANFPPKNAANNRADEDALPSDTPYISREEKESASRFAARSDAPHEEKASTRDKENVTRILTAPSVEPSHASTRNEEGAEPLRAHLYERTSTHEESASTREEESVAHSVVKETAEPLRASTREAAAPRDASQSQARRDNAASTREEESAPDAMQMLSDAHRQISDLLRAMPPLSAPQLEKLGFCGALRHVAQHETHNAFAHVEWNMEEDACASLNALAELRREVVFYAAREAMRNAARHARRAAQQPLRLKVAIQQSNAEITILVEDDGCGLADAAHENATSREYSRLESAAPNEGFAPRGGHGLALHSTLMAVIGGALSLENVAPHGTRVVLTVGLEN